MVRSSFLSLSLCAFCVSSAQSDLPPDPYGERPSEIDGYWPNRGQLIDETGSPTMEASFISEGVYPTAYPMNGGRVFRCWCPKPGHLDS